MHVLVADDNDLLRFTLRSALERLGQTVTEAADGDDCVALLRTTGFDLVIMDAHMPGASLQIRIDAAHEVTPSPRTVILTGGLEAAPQTLASDDVLQKPLSLSTLVNLVSEVDHRAR